jgi:diguanylate cyclase (GGDEF)-like protein/PAS domain S-box-containing protein
MATKKIHILLIEDNPGDARLIEVMLAQTGSLLFSLEHSTFLSDGLDHLGKNVYDVVLLDIGLPDSAGLDSIVEVINKAPDTPVVMMTGLDDEETATSALRMGAQDYLVKGRIDRESLLRSIRYAIERRQVEKDLWSSRQFIQRVTEAAPNIIYVFDLIENRIVYINHTLRDMLGYNIEDIDKMGPGLYERLLHPEDLLRLPELLKRYESAGEGSIIETELRIKHADGHWRWLNTRDIVFTRTPEGLPFQILGTAQDITGRKYMEETIRHYAYHDTLTSLPNRRLLTDRIRHALTQASREGQMAAVLCLDLDKFKEINDTLGHEAGDCVLREVAYRLKSCLRESDTVARTGGDEFVILLYKTAHERDAALIAGKIASAFQKPFVFNGHTLYCSTSIGISLYPVDGADTETLLKNADMAMYQAKEQGRNTYRFYKSSMNEKAVERTKLEELLRVSLEKGELQLHYQPQISIESKNISRVEALVRWPHPERGLLPPSDFLPLAEEAGIIESIDEWVIREACLQNKAWQEAGHPSLCVAVNLSSSYFQRPDLAESVSRILRETGLDPSFLGIEISECAAISERAPFLSNLTDLAGMGTRIILDNFGRGRTPIHYLKKWPLRTLKIDKSFIGGLSTDPDYKPVVHAVINMAHQLDLDVVAEGVETEDQLSCLRSMRCDEMQGYYFSRPLPANECIKIMTH